MTEKIYTDEVIVKKVGSFGSLVKGILIGGLIGAGVAMLSAPRTGRETREILREKGYELRDRASTSVDTTRTRMEDFTREQKERAAEIAQRSQEVLQRQKAKVETAVEGVKEGVKEGMKEGVRTYSIHTETGSSDPMDIALDPDNNPSL